MTSDNIYSYFSVHFNLNITLLRVFLNIQFNLVADADIVEADDVPPADDWFLVLLLSLVRVVPVAVDAVEVSVLVFPGEDSATVVIVRIDDHHLPPSSL